MKRILTYPITESDSDQRIYDFLYHHGYSRHIRTWLKQHPGSVRLNGEEALFYFPLKNGDLLEISLEEEHPSENIVPVDLPIHIIYEDEDLMVIDKTADMPVHPSIGNYENTLANAAAWYFHQQDIPFVFRCINRLDRDTTGLLILAKHMLSGAILSDQMKKRAIHRTYLAITEGKTDPAGTIDSPIGRTDQSLILRQVDHENGDSACTHYLQKCWHPKTFYPETLPVPQDGLSLVQLQLETGRTHQIRVHMTSIGHPLIGDTLYNPETALMNRQALHSYRLAFTHPVTGVSLEFTSPLPEDMVEFFPDCNT
ncbi:RluA family pseudouridine synthase [Blautia faecicola]|uniref:Pseudouridine synthase n=1 Tax=Blautia faecicola TaxID=2509240 RepID=A0A4Q1RIN5_9FIRM|nr:RluA family pseudouridine synthase [Blautia faecicola]RXS75576.1 RluA family pseudouridine synthase [Blautia faecicola]